MNRLFKLSPVLGTFLGMAALAQTPPQQKPPASPQQKIVQKYGLEETLKVVDAVNTVDGNIGCHQPEGDRDEIATYKDFRLVSKRADSQKNLLFVCDSVEGFPAGTINFYSRPDLGVVWVTKGLTHLPQKTRRSAMGHEDTHVFNRDEMADPGPQIATYNSFEIQAANLIQKRQRQGNPLNAFQLADLAGQERTLQNQALNAINNAAAYNHPMEERADRGGLILAAGKKCKIEPEPLITGLEAAYDTLPLWTSQGTISHPNLVEREAILKSSVPDITQACRNYYASRKHPQLDKRPQPD